MYDCPFFISDPVSNNAFSYEKRLNKRIYVPSLVEGGILKARAGKEIAFEDFDDEGVLRSCEGLENFIRADWKGKPVYVFDNHNHAFAFWHLEAIRGLVWPGSLLVHMDRHKDCRKPDRYLSAAEALDETAVFKYANSILNVGNFIPAAGKTGLVKKTVNIDSDDTLKNFDYSLLEKRNPRDGLIFDLDLDFFAPEMDYIRNDMKLEAIKTIAGKSDMVTIATSPFFIKPGLSIEWLRKIAAILQLK